MAKEVCAFCGEEVSSFAVKTVVCGPTSQYACKSCAKEAENLGEAEKCRRALQRRFATSREKMEEFLAVAEGAEELRPSCSLCGGKLIFWTRTRLDTMCRIDDPRTGELNFRVLIARCGGCGKMELFDPELVSGNEAMAYLAAKDMGELS